MPAHDLEGKVALVTGASGDIGGAIAVLLAARGAAVAVNYYGSADAAAAVVKKIEAKGGRAIATQADVSDPDQVSAMFKIIESELGNVDILVNNAGVPSDGNIVGMTYEEWRLPQKVILDGAFFCIQAVLRSMRRARWGRIINISSIVGIRGNRGQCNYAVAKAGLDAITKSLSFEHGPKGITVNSVAPGYIDTNMTAGLPEAVKAAATAATPVGRFGTAEEVAAVVGFLASPEAGDVNGAVWEITGGIRL